MTHKRIAIIALGILLKAGMGLADFNPPAGNYIVNSSTPRVNDRLNIGSGTISNFNASTVTFRDGSRMTTAPSGSGFTIYPATGTAAFPKGLTASTGTFSRTITANQGINTTTATIGSLSGILKATAGVVAGSATTTDLTEGSNLYFTTARATSAVSATSPPLTYANGVFGVDATSVTLKGQDVLAASSASVTYAFANTTLSNSSATATYVNQNSLGAYLTGSSATLTYMNVTSSAALLTNSSATLTYAFANLVPTNSSVTATYLNSNTASLTYLAQSSAAATYMNITSSGAFLTKSSATATYAVATNVLANSSASVTYANSNNVLFTSSAIVTYMNVTSSATLLTTSSASLTYANANNALSNSSATVTYLNANTASLTYVTGSSATATYMNIASSGSLLTTSSAAATYQNKNNAVLLTGTNTFTAPTTFTSTTTTMNNINGSSISGLRNLLVNGDMSLDQQYVGTITTNTGTAQKRACDQWFTKCNASDGSFTTQRISTNNLAGFPTALQVVVVSTDGSIAATQSYDLFQNIEGLTSKALNWGTVNGSTATISFWVFSSTTGTQSVTVEQTFNSSARSFASTYTINSPNTWEKKILTIPPEKTGTWISSNGVAGAALIWSFGSGSSRSIAPGSWQNTNAHAATGINSIIAIAGSTFAITGVQFELGSTATAFEYQSGILTLATCERYLWKTFLQSIAPAQAQGSAGPISYTVHTTGIFTDSVHVTFPVTMAFAPAITTYNDNSANANWRNDTAGPDSGVPTVANVGESGFLILNPQVAVTDVVGNVVSIHVMADAGL